MSEKDSHDIEPFREFLDAVAEILADRIQQDLELGESSKETDPLPQD